MHELSIATNIVRIAEREAKNAGATDIRGIRLEIGALSGVVRDALEFAFDVAAKDSMLEGAELTIDEVPVVVFCADCDAEHELPSPPRFRCPGCGTRTGDIRQGRDLDIASLEIV
ncbi:MAG: hydrogenase maturation nickel metallochaperone HypA [Salinivenus sp.]